MAGNIDVLPFVAVIVAQSLITNKKLNVETKIENKQSIRNDGNTLLAAIKIWWRKGEGGEWYEPYVTNGNVVICCLIGIVGGFILTAGCCLL